MFFGDKNIFVWGHHCHPCAAWHKMGTIMWLQKYKIFWGRAKSERHFWQFFWIKKRGCYAPSGAKVRVKAKVTSDKWYLKSLIINNLGVTLSLEIFLKLWLTNVNGALLSNHVPYRHLKSCRKIFWILNTLPGKGWLYLPSECDSCTCSWRSILLSCRHQTYLRCPWWCRWE